MELILRTHPEKKNEFGNISTELIAIGLHSVIFKMSIVMKKFESAGRTTQFKGD